MREAVRHQVGVTMDCEARLLALPGATAVERRADGLWMAAAALDVVALAERMRRMEARLSGMTGRALATGETRILYHYCCPGGLAVNVGTETRGGAIPSVAPVTRAAAWSEREIGDLYGVRFDGHPDPRRLVRPPSLRPGFFREPEMAARRDDGAAAFPSEPTPA